MGKFNKAGVRTAVASPIQTERTPSGTTHQGGPGYSRGAKSELFLLAVTNMVGEQAFYERADARDDRFERLVREVAVADPAWMVEFVIWLRNGANMRSAALVAGLEAAKALVDAKIDTTKMETSSPRLNMGQGAARLLASAGMARADEPGEGLAYWLQRYGVKIPKPVKRGVADAVGRLYTQRNMLKYDTPSHAMRFGRVIDLVHPKPSTPVQSHLFDYAIAKMKGRDVEPDTLLAMITANTAWRRTAAKHGVNAIVNSDAMNAAGLTWEDVLSLAGKSADKKVLWESLIPNMGYMALLRNLRNFDEAGVDDEVAARVGMRLGNPDEVLKSRQLPLRFLSAYRHAPSLRWAYALDRALNACLGNIPKLNGRTLILIDTSGSMTDPMSGRSELVRWDAATAFGLALAARCENADVVSFSDRTRVFPKVAGESLLKSIDRWRSEGYFLNSGTNTVGAVQAHLTGHNRVVILTDEQLQSWGGRSMYEQVASTLDGVVPASTWLHTFNLAGYQRGHAPSGFGTRHTFGGLTDAMFPLIPLLEAGHAGVWPWEMPAS